MSDEAHGRAAYVPRRPGRSRQVEARGLVHHVREWGPADASPLVLLHGARDTSATFQFLVDAFQAEWHVVAPDWRGHGLTGWTPGDYWHATFLCDLDAVLDQVVPGRAVDLVGHSMGGNLAGLYAGLRPGRVSSLVLLDALGEFLSRNPVRIDDVLGLALAARQVAEPPGHAGPADLADRLLRRNRRLDHDRAAFLAASYARPLADGRVGWPYDPSFKRSQPNLLRTEDWTALWRRIAVPTLCLLSSDDRPDAPTSDPGVVRARLACFRDARSEVIPDTGHNLHHDAPDLVARSVETFLQGVRPDLVPRSSPRSVDSMQVPNRMPEKAGSAARTIPARGETMGAWSHGSGNG